MTRPGEAGAVREGRFLAGVHPSWRRRHRGEYRKRSNVLFPEHRVQRQLPPGPPAAVSRCILFSARLASYFQLVSPNKAGIFRGSELRLWGWINKGWALTPTLSWFRVRPEDTLKKDRNTAVYSEPGFLEAPFLGMGTRAREGKGTRRAPH